MVFNNLRRIVNNTSINVPNTSVNNPIKDAMFNVGKQVGAMGTNSNNWGTNVGTNYTINTGINAGVNTGVNAGGFNSGNYNTNFSFTPTNNMGYINDQNKQALDATIASIRAAVQQAKNKQQQVIDQATPTYQNLKNTVFNQSMAGLPAMRENLANLGASTQGGLSRTEETRANSDLQNRLGALDIEKQNVINQANATIADLEAKGMFDEASATRESALNKLQQILAESSRLDTLNYQVGRDTVGDAMANRQFDYGVTQDDRQANQWKQTFDYNASQDLIKNDQWKQQFNESVRQFDKTFDYNSAQDAVKNTQWQQQFDEGVREFDTAQNLREREFALQKIKAAQSSASNPKSSLVTKDIISNIYKSVLPANKATTTTEYIYDENRNKISQTVIKPSDNFMMTGDIKSKMIGQIQNYLSAYGTDSPEFYSIINAGLGLGLSMEDIFPQQVSGQDVSRIDNLTKSVSDIYNKYGNNASALQSALNGLEMSDSDWNMVKKNLGM